MKNVWFQCFRNYYLKISKVFNTLEIIWVEWKTFSKRVLIVHVLRETFRVDWRLLSIQKGLNVTINLYNVRTLTKTLEYTSELRLYQGLDLIIIVCSVERETVG